MAKTIKEIIDDVTTKEAYDQAKEKLASVRSQILHEAEDCVCRDRNSQYGDPEDNFNAIADLWEAYKGVCFSAQDVAIMMTLMKVGRIMTGTQKRDSYVDAIGYLACAGEIAER